jgi:crotonobetainyl-CoA:carnitine CoA-transferase CaiB-like acyl-CoA transferase
VDWRQAERRHPGDQAEPEIGGHKRRVLKELAYSSMNFRHLAQKN